MNDSTVLPFIGGAAEKNFYSKINNGEFYDAHQIAFSLINRFLTRGKDSEAISLCERFGKEFIKSEQFGLAAGVGLLLTKVLTEFELSPTPERINLVLELFTPAPTSIEEDRYKFIERALKWAYAESGGVINEHIIRLHEAAGIAYMDDKEFGKAQGHFLHLDNVPRFVTLLRRWQEYCYTSERLLLSLRLILILLGKGDLNLAEKLLKDPALGISADNSQLPPPLQLAYLIVEACKAKSSEFFEIIRNKYSLVLRRDKTFQRYVSQIKAKYFGGVEPSGGSIVDVMTKLFQ